MLWKAKTNHAVIKNVNAVMVNVPVMDVKRGNPATVIVPAVK